jgi:predicted phosphoribosyltransferase
VFADRREAGRSLAGLLRSEVNPVVLGIARGGVIVAEAVAESLHAPLDMVVVRKVGHPLQPELALGAVSASGESVVTPYAADFFHGALSPLFETQMLRARALDTALRGGIPPLDISGKPVILVDDGIATSATMECAIKHARSAGAARVVSAAPVAPYESVTYLKELCDWVAVPIVSRERDFAVGRYYRDFREVDDRQVTEALARFR